MTIGILIGWMLSIRLTLWKVGDAIPFLGRLFIRLEQIVVQLTLRRESGVVFGGPAIAGATDRVRGDRREWAGVAADTRRPWAWVLGGIRG
jgi:hypothetical protein